MALLPLLERILFIVRCFTQRPFLLGESFHWLVGQRVELRHYPSRCQGALGKQNASTPIHLRHDVESKQFTPKKRKIGQPNTLTLLVIKGLHIVNYAVTPIFA